MTGVFATTFLATQWWSFGHRPTNSFVMLLLTTELLVLLPYAWFLVVYGSPVPATPASIGVSEQVAQLGIHLRGWVPGAKLSLIGYSSHFAIWLLSNWNPITTMTGLANLACTLCGSTRAVAGFPCLYRQLPLAVLCRRCDQCIRYCLNRGIASACIVLIQALSNHRIAAGRRIPKVLFPRCSGSSSISGVLDVITNSATRASRAVLSNNCWSSFRPARNLAVFRRWLSLTVRVCVLLLMIFCVFIDAPLIVDPLPGEDVLYHQHRRHHGMVLVVVLMHTISTHQV